MAASEKLSHLLQLADQGPALRMALAEEVTELLADWPSDYPENMRDVCEALLPHGSQALVQAARNGEDLTALLAESLSVKDETARQILDDDSGATLAVACKGANIDRAVFSTVALLMRLRRDRSHAFAVLNAFDDVPMGEASRVLQGWR